MKINILGTEYTLEVMQQKEDAYLEKADGYCDKTSKKIVVKARDDGNELDDYEVYLKKIKRHEIIHAFLFESGLHENWTHPDCGHDETYVDWIAAQFPKLLAAFQAADCI